jgi:hypothetical protein
MKDFFKILKIGQGRRKTFKTAMNDRSSRSHTVLMLFLSITKNKGTEEETNTKSKLNLVDLAGSERIS